MLELTTLYELYICVCSLYVSIAVCDTESLWSRQGQEHFSLAETIARHTRGTQKHLAIPEGGAEGDHMPCKPH